MINLKSVHNAFAPAMPFQINGTFHDALPLRLAHWSNDLDRLLHSIFHHNYSILRWYSDHEKDAEREELDDIQCFMDQIAALLDDSMKRQEMNSEERFRHPQIMQRYRDEGYSDKINDMADMVKGRHITVLVDDSTFVPGGKSWDSVGIFLFPSIVL